jgi:predicted MPP superfamily phosphohydrolase
MTLGPFLLWRLEHCQSCHALSVAGAWLVYGWMGLSFLFFWFGVSWDLIGWATRTSGLPWPDARHSFLTLATATVAVGLYGFYAAWHPSVERFEIRSNKLPADFPGLRLVQISDVHLGVLAGRQRLASILRQVAALKPDILVSTGDLVDAQAQYLDGRSEQFAAFRPPLGKFAVTGNHEHYAGLQHAIQFHRNAGFQVLRENGVDVGGITLFGVDDPAVLGAQTDDAELLNRLPKDRFVILLKHQPVVDPKARFDLQLSGHTHAGQIFPFGVFVRWVYAMDQGRYDLANGGVLYVSRGTGTWGPPIRFLAPAEITLIELKPAG